MSEPQSMKEPTLGAFRPIPYMGVIWVVAEAMKLGFRNGHQATARSYADVLRHVLAFLILPVEAVVVIKYRLPQCPECHQPGPRRGRPTPSLSLMDAAARLPSHRFPVGPAQVTPGCGSLI